jgi:XTP/dITP diphosphohydrolase
MKLYLATGNAHKIGEVSAILAASGIAAEVLPPSAVGGMPDVVEDGDTFEANARIKALALLEQVRAHNGGCSNWIVVADDSGICVDALNGQPGIRSARFAGENAIDADNNAKLLTLLEDVPGESRTAAFHCAIVAAFPDGRTQAFEGHCPGKVLRAARGAAGFGYDPLFLPDGYNQTAAELPEEIKNTISHRARALVKFVDWLKHRG